jgi:Zn-dependent protease
MSLLDYIILGIVFLSSIILHEVAHGLAAYAFGDDTAMRAGRLTLNPFKHLDVLGTIFLIIVLTTGFGIGWAKPVPIDPRKFSNFRVGLFATALAGPATNIALALLALILAFFHVNGILSFPGIETLVWSLFFLNMLLATFNLVPIPPLDGSRIVSSVLPIKLLVAYNRLERYGILIILLTLFVPFPGLGAPPLRIALTYMYNMHESWFNWFIRAVQIV